MPEVASVVVVGGTRGIGQQIARNYASRGHEVVLTGRDGADAEAVADEIGGRTRGLALELAEPTSIAAALAGVDRVDHLVLAAIDRDENTVADYKIAAGLHLVTLKLVGYTEVVHTLLPRFAADGSVVLFGGLAKERPYPGSLTISTVNGGVTGLMHALAVEIAPIRVNAIHPGIVGDSPYWSARPPAVLDVVRERTPTGRTVAVADIVHAVDFLITNPSVNGVDLMLEGGTLLR